MPIALSGINKDQGSYQSPIIRRTPYRTINETIGHAIKLQTCVFPTNNNITSPSLNMDQRRSTSRIIHDVAAIILDRQVPVVLCDNSITAGFADHIPLQVGNGGQYTEVNMLPGAFTTFDISTQNGCAIWSDNDIAVYLDDLNWPFTITRARFIKSKYEGTVAIDFRATNLAQISFVNISNTDAKITLDAQFVINL